MISTKRKGCRWNRLAKVTAFSVETTWKNRALAGTGTSCANVAKSPVSLYADVTWDVKVPVKVGAKEVHKVRTKIGTKFKKRWDRQLLVRRRRNTGWKQTAPVSVQAGTNWKVVGHAERHPIFVFKIRRPVGLSVKVSYGVEVNPSVRSGGWNVLKTVRKRTKVRFKTKAKVGVSVQTNWASDTLNWKRGTKWKAVGRIIKPARVGFDTLTSVQRKIGANWRVLVKVYSLKIVRYASYEGMRHIVIPARPRQAVIPNMTWNRLSSKKKKQLSK